MKSIENKNHTECDNNSSNDYDASDNEDLSFTFENNYRQLYDDSIKRRTPAIKEKYFNLFSCTTHEKIGNHVESTLLENRKKVTWGTLYENVIRKIVNPFGQEKGKMLLTLEEIDRRIGVILKDRDLEFKVVSKSEKTEDSYTRNRIKNLQNETLNFVPQLMNKVNAILLDKKESLCMDSIAPDLFSLSPQRISVARPSSSPKRVLLNQYQPKSLLFGSNRNSQGNSAKKKEIQRGSANEIPTKNNEALKHGKDKFEPVKKKDSARNLSMKVLDKLSKVYENYDKTNEVGEAKAILRKIKTVKSPDAKLKINDRRPYSGESEPGNESNSAELSEMKKNEKKLLLSFSKIMKIPFELYPPNKSKQNSIEKLAYLDEFDRYKHFKKTISQPGYASEIQQNKFKAIYHLIDFKDLSTLAKEPNDMNEVYKRGKLLEFHKQLSECLVNQINTLCKP